MGRGLGPGGTPMIIARRGEEEPAKMTREWLDKKTESNVLMMKKVFKGKETDNQCETFQ